jgi:hypothetical protein
MRLVQVLVQVALLDLSVGSSPLSASDPDVFWSPSQTLSFSIISGGSGYFSIVSSTGQLQLTSLGAQITSLDFEVTPSYILLIQGSRLCWFCLFLQM